MIAQFKACGLYDRADQVILGVLGEEELELVDRQFEVVRPGASVSACEFPTLQKLWAHCQVNQGVVLYFHLKGVLSGKVVPHFHHCRRYLAHFVIGRHEECVPRRRADPLERFSNPLADQLRAVDPLSVIVSVGVASGYPLLLAIEPPSVTI